MTAVTTRQLWYWSPFGGANTDGMYPVPDQIVAYPDQQTSVERWPDYIAALPFARPPQTPGSTTANRASNLLGSGQRWQLDSQPGQVADCELN